ncbi:flagellar motor protein MotB [Effusibacillus dendaii]|uniref:Flagellar motor protein MotB n=1 Tax=Effusibacillus dendaii TaxID=2743772 RepID=A0A7I8DCS5_9BACL|nr:flagellar motor protein MotB [Effusibacillus dendaii]BCJ88003.1 flagellar motor protein MotB [Effusibacillus dendaii]
MSKKRHRHENHIDETWLLPYSDLLTLLLALFIVLFAMSTIDAKKFEQMVQSFDSALNGGTRIFEQPSPVQSPNPTSAQPPESAKNQTQHPDTTAKPEDLDKLKQKLDAYIKENQLTGQIETVMLPDGLNVIIRDVAFFRSGSADIRPETRKLATTMSEILAQFPRQMAVSGYTDNVPIHNSEFDSNWDLSAKRAINFMKELLKNPRLDPKNFSATGYGEYRPVTNNDTEENRAMNRRVELFIAR